MRLSLTRWLESPPIADPIERRLAPVYQIVLVLWILLVGLGIPANGVLTMNAGTPAATPAPDAPAFVSQNLAILGVSSTLLLLTPIVALALVRRGRFGRSVDLAALGYLAAHSLGSYAFGVSNGAVLVMFQIPIALAGLLGRQRLLPAISALSVAVVIVVGVLESAQPPMAGLLMAAVATMAGAPVPPHAPSSEIGMDVGFFAAVTLLISILIDRFGRSFRDALATAHASEEGLRTLSASLEQTVADRTAALQESLRESETRAAEQALLLAEVEQQRATIQDLAVPVIPLSARTLVIPLIGALDTERLQQLQAQALQAIERRGARTLILDITGVPVVDTQVAHGFLMTMHSARLLGAGVLLVGIRPEVAQTIVGLGIDLQGVRTYSDLRSALGSLGTLD